MKISKILFLFMLATLFAYQVSLAGNGDKPGKKVATLKADTQKSTVKWHAKKVTGEHYGTVKLSNGSLDVEKGRLTGGNFEVDMNSIVCEDLTNAEYNGKLVGHLKSEDFFTVEKHPKANFKITKAAPIASAKAGENNYNITGDLVIKGITQSITFPAQVNINGNKAEAKAKFDVDRTKYDIKFRSGNFFENLGDKMIDDNFTLDLNLVTSEQI